MKINITPGPAVGTLHSQTKIRIEQIARYRIAGVRDQKICELLQIEMANLRYIMSLQDYKETEEALLTGQLTAMDKELAGKVDALKGQVRSAVPAALRCLVDTVNQRRDLRTALAAATEILDRDPDRTFSAKQASSEETPHIPDIVLDQAAKDADKVVEQLNKARKEVVN
jgi:hypothetical protein